MAITIRTRTKSDLAQIRDPSVLRLRLPPTESVSQWIDRVQARVQELTATGTTCMRKPEFQALLLMGNLPRTILWSRFQMLYRLESRPGTWNRRFYADDKWVLTLEALRCLMHFHAQAFPWGNNPAPAHRVVVQRPPRARSHRVPRQARQLSDAESFGDNFASSSFSQNPRRNSSGASSSASQPSASFSRKLSRFSP